MQALSVLSVIFLPLTFLSGYDMRLTLLRSSHAHLSPPADTSGETFTTSMRKQPTNSGFWLQHELHHFVRALLLPLNNSRGV